MRKITPNLLNLRNIYAKDFVNFNQHPPIYM